jgi:hypothetical protein
VLEPDVRIGDTHIESANLLQSIYQPLFQIIRQIILSS